MVMLGQTVFMDQLAWRSCEINFPTMLRHVLSSWVDPVAESWTTGPYQHGVLGSESKAPWVFSPPGASSPPDLSPRESTALAELAKQSDLTHKLPKGKRFISLDMRAQGICDGAEVVRIGDPISKQGNPSLLSYNVFGKRLRPDEDVAVERQAKVPTPPQGCQRSLLRLHLWWPRG